MSTADDKALLATLREASTIEQMREALARANRRLSSKIKNHEELVAAVYQAASDAALSIGKLPKPPKADNRDRAAESALIHLTDWQYGKYNDTFNRDICSDRVDQVMQTVVDITDLHRSAVPVTRADIMFGGDMVEGTTIFPGQVWEVDTSLYDQLFGVARVMANAVHAAVANFELVHIWEEFGNHGRLGRKGEQPSVDNIDRMGYGLTREMLGLKLTGPSTWESEDGNVIWHGSTSWYQLVKVGNYHALLVHGDEINSYGGNHPSYGIVKKVNGWKSGVVEPFADCYMGHFHRPDTYTLADGRSIFITGTLESGNEYAREFMAATGHPQQRLHFIRPDKGEITAEYRIRA